MAILKLGVLVSGISGTIGGTTYSRNKAGPFARAWSRGADPQTTSQTTTRGRLSSHATEWQDLAQGDRDDWDTYAAAPAQELTNSLGEAYYASGWNWYCRINNHLLVAGRARRDTFPEAGRPTIPDASGLAIRSPITDNSKAAFFLVENEFTGYDCILFLSFAPSEALLWRSRGYLLTHAGAQSTTTRLYVGDELLALFGQPIVGSKAFASLARQNTEGERSPASTVTDVVSAA